MEITHQETDADQAKFVVKGYDGDDKNWTEVDLYTDDPTNLYDGTWSEPQIWREEAEEQGCVVLKSQPITANDPTLQLDVADATAIIEKRGGSVATFEVSEDPWPPYALPGNWRKRNE